MEECLEVMKPWYLGCGDCYTILGICQNSQNCIFPGEVNFTLFSFEK